MSGHLALDANLAYNLQPYVFEWQDFGDSLPGHGGMTDRMDCQVCYHNRHYHKFWSLKCCFFNICAQSLSGYTLVDLPIFFSLSAFVKLKC